MASRAGLVLASLLVGLMLLELGCRVAGGTLGDWHNIVLKERREIRALSDGRMTYDAVLGWVPSRSYASEGRSYDARGFRATPFVAGSVLDGPPILVAGDSIAHGDELTNLEAWPTQLQRLLRRSVINAAVGGYGLDQIVLRAEKLVPETRPAQLVVSFASDDLRRSEMKRVWGVEKPYFELADGKLILRNSPVPISPDPATTLDLWQRLFGWSVLVDTVLRHEGWQFEWSSDHARVLARGAGERMACPLLQRLAALKVPTLIVAEYNRWVFQDMEYQRETRRQTALVLKCAAEAGLQALDMFETIDQAVRDQGLDAVFKTSHPGPLAARLTAEKIAGTLK